MSNASTKPVIIPVVAPKKKAGEKKGARFVSFFGFDPSPELIQVRVDKIVLELNALAAIAQDVETKGGDPGEFNDTHTQLALRLKTIRESKDTPKVRHGQLAQLKDDARKAVKDATVRAPDAIREGIDKTEKAAEQLRLAIAKKRATVENNMLEIKSLLDKAPGPLPKYLEQYTTAQENCLAAARESNLQKASGLWQALLLTCSGLLTNIPLEAECIEPEKAATFWLGKMDTAVKALKPDKDLDEAGVKQAKALRDAVEGLNERKELADAGRLVNRKGHLLTICDEASRLYEPMKLAELGATLPSSTPLARNQKLDEVAQSLAGKEDLESQATMRAAITLRFGIEFASSDEFSNPLGAGIKKLGPLYDVLKLVPAAHLVAKEGTMQLSYKEALPGAERPNKFAKRDVPVEKGGGKISTIVMTLPPDGEKIKKKNARGEETELEFFQSTALHEIGHAVDDKEGFMEKNRKSAGYGQWLPSSRAQVREKYVALLEKTVGTGHKSNLESYIDACLDGKTPKQPAAGNEPFYALLTHWSTLATTGGILRGLREGGALWYKGGSAASAAASDERGYLEAFPDQWWSFHLSERSASVAEYQWRAPGEWFAEAYSLFYLGKLLESHPVAEWCRA